MPFTNHFKAVAIILLHLPSLKPERRRETSDCRNLCRYVLMGEEGRAVCVYVHVCVCVLLVIRLRLIVLGEKWLYSPPSSTLGTS